MHEKLTKPYDPQSTETRIYQIWEESGFFNPDNLPNQTGKPFTIMMPPPNATGILHMGHALGLTIQDIAIRYKRMQGFKTLWLPGTDHAAIATQAKVEKDIYKKEKKSRYDLGREELLTRIADFVSASRGTIQSQIRTFGASCDWSREAFTLDEDLSLAVRTMFKKMYDDGLIYRGSKVINWDPKGATTIADDEIVYEERQAKFYTFKYSADFPIAISTTRPETKIGDVAVAVHPNDARYQKFVGQEYEVVFCDVPLKIKIIADESVDPDLGTGALGVTPAHSIIDWEIAERHHLEGLQVIDERARMLTSNENLQGKKTTEARDIIVDWLKKENLLIKEETITQNVSTAERTGAIIEPLPKTQWFVDVNKEFTLPENSTITSIPKGSKTTLKKLLRQVVDADEIDILPEHFKKTYFNWIDNLRDWCISRQIWYGHRIPVWYKGAETYCGTTPPTGDDWVQDEDVLDTWFSSGLWTFSTLGWPENTSDLQAYHPTDILVTAHEILFPWVARMILMTGYGLGQIPFKKVLLTGIVRDTKGQKFSKSLGNGIDPMDIAHKFGADAGRMSLIVGTAPGTDMKIDENKIKGYKHFANKIWNMTRFILSNTEDIKYDPNFTDFTSDDKTLKENNQQTIKDITTDMENYRFHLAAEKIYHYAWHIVADEILEASKDIFNASDITTKNSRAQLLFQILRDILICLHPFMPFITEELWHLANFNQNLLLVEPWPQANV